MFQIWRACHISLLDTLNKPWMAAILASDGGGPCAAHLDITWCVSRGYRLTPRFNH
jgi:hypothetical protein